MSDEAKQSENPFEGVRIVNGTLVIPSDRYNVRKITVERVDDMRLTDGEWEVPCDVHYEVTPAPGWQPRVIFSVTSG